MGAATGDPEGPPVIPERGGARARGTGAAQVPTVPKELPATIDQQVN